MTHLVRKLLLLSGMMFLLAGCSSVDDYIYNINPFIKKEPPLPGSRQPVLANDPNLQLPEGGARAIAIGPAVALNEWRNPGGPNSNNPGNIAISSATTQVWRVQGGSEDDRVGAPPIIVGGKLIIYNNRQVVAYSTSNGGTIWSADTLGEDAENPVVGGGVTSDGERIYVATGTRRLIALDAQTGNRIWEATLSEPARSAPSFSGNKLFLVTTGSVVYALSAANGQEIWRYSGIPESGSLLSSSAAAIVGNLVVVPFASGEVVALDSGNGQVKWSSWLSRALRTASISTLADIAGRPVNDRGLIIAGSVSGRVLAIKEANGERVWERSIGTAYTPAVSGDGVFLVSLQGEAYGLDRATGTVRWATKLPKDKERDRVIFAGPLLAGGTLWIGSNKGKLIGIDARTGEITSQRELGAENSIIQPPMAVGGRLFVITGRGGVIAFD